MMAQALQSRLESIDVSDPRLYQDDTWRPLFAKLRRDDPVHYCEASAFGSYGLAEQQLRILREKVLKRDLRFEIAGPLQRLYSNFIRGIRSLPVRIVN